MKKTYEVKDRVIQGKKKMAVYVEEESISPSSQFSNIKTNKYYYLKNEANKSDKIEVKKRWKKNSFNGWESNGYKWSTKTHDFILVFNKDVTEATISRYDARKSS